MAPENHEIQSQLGQLLDDRGMSVYELSRRTEIDEGNLRKLKNGHVRSIRFTTLSAICQALECQPGDLLTFVPAAESEEAVSEV